MRGGGAGGYRSRFVRHVVWMVATRGNGVAGAAPGEAPRKFTAAQLSAMVGSAGRGGGMEVDGGYSSEDDGEVGPGNTELDLGNLLCWDPSPMDERSLTEDVEDTVRDACTRTVTVLLHELFRLPSRPATPGR